MKNLCRLALLGALSAVSISAFSAEPQGLSTQEQQATVQHMKLLSELKSMYMNKHFSNYLFDTKNGYLQTSLSSEDKMPMQFFIDYNNMWWFSVIDKVEVPAIAYDYENNTGFIALNIYYDGKYILRGTQLVKFNGDKINYIRTYASSTFFSTPDPLVQLDSAGNSFFLDTGYGLPYSAEAAQLYFQSPHGLAFAEDPVTAPAVKRLKVSLQNYLKTGTTQN